MQVRVGGTWVSAIAPWGDLSWSHSWPGGCKEASFGAYFAPGERDPRVYRGALVEVMHGPSVVWAGELDEPDWRSGQFKALGMVYGADNYPCITSGGDATSTLSVAIDQAVTDGWRVTRGSSIPTTAYTTDAEGLNSIAALAASHSDELGQRFAVRADRIAVMEADPTTPKWQIIPNVVDLGNASDDYASTIVVRYHDSATGTYLTAKRTDSTAAARFGAKFLPVDATELGPITTARANAIGDGILIKGRARLSWTSSITVSPNELLTIGGVPAPLDAVVAGELVRVQGIFDDLHYLAGHTYLDVVIGETNYAPGSDVITLSPVGAASETLSEIVEETLTLAAQAAA